MDYSALVQAYFERSVALQWYWTVYIIVIGGLLGFTTLRQRPELVTTILVTVLYACFAYKNLGAIEATLAERHGILAALKATPASGPREAEIVRAREHVEPTLTLSEPEGVRTFHLACDVMTIAIVWAKEFRRRRSKDHKPAV